MPIFRRHQRACESSDGPPLYHIQVTNACVCTLLHAFSLWITTFSIKNVHRTLLPLPPNKCLSKWSMFVWSLQITDIIRGASITQFERSVFVSQHQESFFFFFVKCRSRWCHKTYQFTLDGANSASSICVSGFFWGGVAFVCISLVISLLTTHTASVKVWFMPPIMPWID